MVWVVREHRCTLGWNEAARLRIIVQSPRRFACAVRLLSVAFKFVAGLVKVKK